MKYSDEKHIMDKLGIDTWRNLSKDKFLEYVAIIPDVSESVRLKIIEQLPACLSFTKDLIETIKYQQENIVNGNSKSTEGVINSLNAIQKSLDHLGDKSELSFDEIRYICDKQMELAKIYNELDKRNKDFLKYMWNGVVVFGLAILTFVGTILGNKYLGGKGDDIT